MQKIFGQSKNLLIRTVVLVLIVAGLAVFCFVSNAAASQKLADVQNAANSSTRGQYTKDGTFTGSAKGYGGQTTVQVTVTNGYITDVEVTDCLDDPPYIANVISSLIPDLISEQTTTIDVVTNASYSSNGVRFAVRDALRSAGAMSDEENDAIAALPTGAKTDVDEFSIGYLMDQQKKETVASHSSGVAGGK